MTVHKLHEASPCHLHQRGKNRLLSLLPADERELVCSDMEQVSMNRGQVLFPAHEVISHVFFSLSAVASLVITMDDGDTVEVATVGNEGLIGVPVLLGSDRSTVEAFTQIHGDYLRMNVDTFRRTVERSGAFSAVMHRYAQAFIAQAAQSTACNRLHSLDQRLCRWILMTHDRVGADHLPLTQEFLAMMLGVRRASVATVAGMLQTAGMIRYHRGTIDVLDRKALEEGSCECYWVVRREHERLLC
jgi:CRP-like cAMP-binding protein